MVGSAYGVSIDCGNLRVGEKKVLILFKELLYQTIGKIFFLFLQKYLNREFILEIPRVALKYKESNI